MTTVEKLIPVIRQNSKKLTILMDEPNPTDPLWMEDVGDSLRILSDIYSGDYRGNGVTLEVRRLKKDRFAEIKKQLFAFIEKVKK